MILGVESSCDDSGLSLFDPKQGLLRHWVMSQAIHAQYGGVVPALAAREHEQNFPALLKACVDSFDLSSVSEIAVTYGPGLVGSLAIGIALAKALKLKWGVPLYGVNHLRGHALSPWMAPFLEGPKGFTSYFQSLCPHLGLLVSGGNTLLFVLQEDFSIKILAQTQDDAAGEALDKGAKLLGLPYPGGPHIERLAQQGNAQRYAFPRAYAHQDEMKLSFSGLKTSLLYFLQKLESSDISIQLPDICASYQEAVIDALMQKVELALQQGTFRSLGLSGGVSQNLTLRQRIQEIAQSHHLPCHCASKEHAGDNAAMIAFAAYVDRKHLTMDCEFDLTFNPSLELC